MFKRSYSGLFTNGCMPMEYKKRKEKLNTPTLELMTKTALKVIAKNEKGFFLMVCIDIENIRMSHVQIILRYKLFKIQGLGP